MQSIQVHSAAVIGNGTSRKTIKLDKLEMPTFGCNRIVDEFHPTYVVAIDEPMIQYLWKSSYPNHRVLTPPQAERWEPAQLHPQGARIRSNAGMNACLEAMKRGFYKLYCFGFDFLIMSDDAKAGNVFDGQEGYANRATPAEAARRLNYFKFIANYNKDVVFFPVFPDETFQIGIHSLNVPNIIPIRYSDFKKETK